MTFNQEQFISGIHYATGKTIDVIIKHGVIHAIHTRQETGQEAKMIAPGLVDLQINGYKGIDFNDQPLAKDEWEKVIEDLTSVGVTTFYPTVITNSFEQLVHIFKKNVAYLQKHPEIKQFVGGFHLEGPYISRDDGPRGAHAKEHVRAPSWEEFYQLQEAAQGMIKLLTLSPEWSDASQFIKKVSRTGVKIAIGHTAATTEQIQAAVEAGAVLSTHLGNGAHAQLPRHPNYIWEQLTTDELWASVIADGHHLPLQVLKVIQKIKAEKMILVSDSVALAGMEPGNYMAPVGGHVTLTESGRLHLRDHPRLLAGSATNLWQGVHHLISRQLVDMKEAIHKASLYPALLMKLPQAKGLSVGAPADLIVFAPQTWDVMRTYKNGELIFHKQ